MGQGPATEVTLLRLNQLSILFLFFHCCFFPVRRYLAMFMFSLEVMRKGNVLFELL